MQGLASFDRWLTRRVLPAARLVPLAPATAPARYLVGPTPDTVRPLTQHADAAEILRAAHGLGPQDWCGMLADDAHSRGCRLAWRLATWPAQGGAAPRWLSAPLLARPGESAADLRRAALERGLQALWAQGWRLVEAGPHGYAQA